MLEVQRWALRGRDWKWVRWFSPEGLERLAGRTTPGLVVDGGPNPGWGWSIAPLVEANPFLPSFTAPTFNDARSLTP